MEREVGYSPAPSEMKQEGALLDAWDVNMEDVRLMIIQEWPSVPEAALEGIQSKLKLEKLDILSEAKDSSDLRERMKAKIKELAEELRPEVAVKKVDQTVQPDDESEEGLREAA